MMKTNNLNTCCVFGHRKIEHTMGLQRKLTKIIEKLIVKNGIDTFLFGSKSEFNRLCLKTVTKLKEKYPYIKRVYVRAEYPYIDEDFKNYILQSYEETYYPEKVKGAGKNSYVIRNFEMIDNSSHCICYYNKNYSVKGKSGTKIAYNYALNKNLKIYNLYKKFYIV